MDDALIQIVAVNDEWGLLEKLMRDGDLYGPEYIWQDNFTYHSPRTGERSEHKTLKGCVSFAMQDLTPIDENRLSILTDGSEGAEA